MHRETQTNENKRKNTEKETKTNFVSVLLKVEGELFTPSSL